MLVNFWSLENFHILPIYSFIRLVSTDCIYDHRTVYTNCAEALTKWPIYKCLMATKSKSHSGTNFSNNTTTFILHALLSFCLVHRKCVYIFRWKMKIPGKRKFSSSVKLMGQRKTLTEKRNLNKLQNWISLCRTWTALDNWIKSDFPFLYLYHYSSVLVLFWCFLFVHVCAIFALNNFYGMATIWIHTELNISLKLLTGVA